MSELFIGVRELKTYLRKYLGRAKIGDMITITEHGKVIGRIIPASGTIQVRMHHLVKAGRRAWSGRKPAPRQPIAVNQGDRSITDLISEDRE